MASGLATKCPVCGRAVAVGLVSQTLIQHENKLGERCAGTGMAPVTKVSAEPRTTSARAAGGTIGSVSSSRTSVSGGSGSGSAARQAAPRTSPAVKRGVSVRRVEVDQDRLRERAEKQERLRLEREARARARNEFYTVELGDEHPEADGESAPQEADGETAQPEVDNETAPHQEP